MFTMSNEGILFEQIYDKCKREHWFGPELSNNNPKYTIDESELCSDDKTAPVVTFDDPRCFNFAFPKANEEQMQITESRLGFALPHLLRNLYQQIANGGFGPGTGLRGVYEGYGSIGSGWYPQDDDTIPGAYQFESRKRIIELAEYEGQWTERKMLSLSYGEWPQYLLPICDLGCVQEACVDTHEQMFLVTPVESDDVYCLWRLPWTFEEWLWRWVRDEELIPRN